MVPVGIETETRAEVRRRVAVSPVDVLGRDEDVATEQRDGHAPARPAASGLGFRGLPFRRGPFPPGSQRVGVYLSGALICLVSGGAPRRAGRRRARTTCSPTRGRN